jgi:hypothetical protein
MACNIPVFRYALENWQPDTYHILVVGSRPFRDDERSLVERIQQAALDPKKPANLQVISIETPRMPIGQRLAEELRGPGVSPAALQQLEALLTAQPLDPPQLFAICPQAIDKVAWQASLTPESVDQLVDSPLRQEIARRLLAGQSAVWVLVECGEPAQDQAAWEQLQSYVVESLPAIELPDRTLIQTDESFRPDVAIELKVEFSALRLSADDQRERAFAAMLRASEPDLAELREPIAIPVYGRGRSYYALVGRGISAANVTDAGQFLCGACSCQVKHDNPGVDLLMAVAWSDAIRGVRASDVELPPLTGAGALELVQLPPVQSTSTAPPSEKKVAAELHRVASPDDAVPVPSTLLWGVLGGSGAALGLVALAGWLLRRQT